MIFTDLGLMDKESYNSTKQADIQVVGKAPDHGWLYWNKDLCNVELSQAWTQF